MRTRSSASRTASRSTRRRHRARRNHRTRCARYSADPCMSLLSPRHRSVPPSRRPRVNDLASASSSALARNTLGPAPVTATRTPLLGLRDEHADQREARGRLRELDVGGLLAAPGSCTDGDDLAGRSAVSYRPLKKSSAAILRLFGLHRRVEAEHRRRIVRPRDRRWRSSRRSCPCCAPAGRRCRSASAASAGIATCTSVDAATSACASSRRSRCCRRRGGCPAARRCAERSTSVPGCARRSFIAGDEALPAGERLAARLRRAAPRRRPRESAVL